MPDYLRSWAHGIFLGIKSVQWQSDLWLWEQFFQENKIASFIELGYGHGGTSLFFFLQGIQHDFRYLGFDVKEPEITNLPLCKRLGIDKYYFKVGDIFTNNFGYIREKMDKLEHPIMLFCDDGDKPREVATFAPYLQAGDYCAVHDWDVEFRRKDVPEYLEDTFTEWPEQLGALTRWFIKR